MIHSWDKSLTYLSWSSLPIAARSFRSSIQALVWWGLDLIGAKHPAVQPHFPRMRFDKRLRSVEMFCNLDAFLHFTPKIFTLPGVRQIFEPFFAWGPGAASASSLLRSDTGSNGILQDVNSRVVWLRCSSYKAFNNDNREQITPAWQNLVWYLSKAQLF